MIFETLDNIWSVYHVERRTEINGIVQTINSENFPMWKAVMVNIIYELDSYCTSIIAKQADGKIIHGRNLDFDFAPQLRGLVF